MVGDDLFQVAKVGKADPSCDRQLRDQLADITRSREYDVVPSHLSGQLATVWPFQMRSGHFV